MKRFKKLVLTFSVIGALSLGTTSVFAETELNKLNNHNDIIQYQLDAFDSVDIELKNQQNYKGFNKDSKDERASSYPTRKGVILVTKDGSFGELVGHAGIIYSTDETVESFPDGGVQKYRNNWNTRYSTVYGSSVTTTSFSEDANAADIAYSYIGKPYNWIFTNTKTTSKFYCSQLVYRSFLDAANINLNEGGWIVFPIDLVQSNYTYTFYTQGI